MRVDQTRKRRAGDICKGTPDIAFEQDRSDGLGATLGDGQKILISNFSKMALTILIKFCEFIVHSKPNDRTLSAFPGKNP